MIDPNVPVRVHRHPVQQFGPFIANFHTFVGPFHDRDLFAAGRELVDRVFFRLAVDDIHVAPRRVFAFARRIVDGDAFRRGHRELRQECARMFRFGHGALKALHPVVGAVGHVDFARRVVGRDSRRARELSFAGTFASDGERKFMSALGEGESRSAPEHQRTGRSNEQAHQSQPARAPHSLDAWPDAAVGAGRRRASPERARTISVSLPRHHFPLTLRFPLRFRLQFLFGSHFNVAVHAIPTISTPLPA